MLVLILANAAYNFTKIGLQELSASWKETSDVSQISAALQKIKRYKHAKSVGLEPHKASRLHRLQQELYTWGFQGVRKWGQLGLSALSTIISDYREAPHKISQCNFCKAVLQGKLCK